MRGKWKTWVKLSAVLAVAAAVTAGVLYQMLEPRANATTASSPVTMGVETQISLEKYQPLLWDGQEVFQGPLILVNNEYPYRPIAQQLTSVYDSKTRAYKVKDKKVQLSPELMEPLNRMMDDFNQATEIGDAMILSGYRSEEEQAQLYKKRVGQKGEEAAAKWVARPGYSEHHTGYAWDFGIYHDNGRSEDFYGQRKYKWLNDHCQEYGFIVRYYEDKTSMTGIAFEPWHFRYVGEPHAEFITKKGFCLEEYIAFLKNYPFGKVHLTLQGADGKKYEVYFVEAIGEEVQVFVPKNRRYTISGNNVDGFIVTSQWDA